jgi:pimeloyl-ACP methyl ester carboxylesterase
MQITSLDVLPPVPARERRDHGATSARRTGAPSRPTRFVRAAVALGNLLAPNWTLATARRLVADWARGDGGAFTDGEKSYVARGGVRIAVHRWGPTGRPKVLLLHDWAGSSGVFHVWLEPLLAAGYCVVAFDQAGHGDSGGTPSPHDFPLILREMAAQIGPVEAIIAHGLGALASLQLLAERPIARKAILLSPPTEACAPVRAFLRTIGLSALLAERFLALLDASVVPGTPAGTPWLRAPVIACPALIIHDLDDESVPWVDGECYARHWRDSHLLTTTGLGHAGVASSLLSIVPALRFLHGETVGARVVASPDINVFAPR